MDAEDDYDEAYLTLPSSENLEEKDDVNLGDSAGTSEKSGEILSGSIAKERSTMNIKDSLLRASSGEIATSTVASSSGIKASDYSTSFSLNPNVITPTTDLSVHLKAIKFTGEGKFPSLCESPTSNSFPSLAESDCGYGSMPSMTSLEKSEEMLVHGVAGVEGNVREASVESMEVDYVKKLPRVTVQRTTSPSQSTSSKIDVIETSSLCPLESRNSERVALEGQSIVARYDAKSPSPVPTNRLASRSLARSESPNIPAVGESIEIITESVPTPVEHHLLEGVLSKRSAVRLSEGDLGPSSKSPRLSPEGKASKKAIRVSTIVSPPGERDRLSPRPSKRKSHSPVITRDRSPSHSPGPSLSTTTTASATIASSMDTSQTERTFQAALPLSVLNLSTGFISTTTAAATTPTGVPQVLYHLLIQHPQQTHPQTHPQTQSKPARVNFKDVHDMSKSDRPSGVRPQLITVDSHSRQDGNPVMIIPSEVHHQSLEQAKLAVSVPSPMNVVSLISPHSSRHASSSPIRSRSLSPHSPQVDKSSAEQREDTGAGGTLKSRGEEAEPVQNALLKVSEAHLAILPDEDGDTPLHLSVIHENLDLTKYLIRLIKGVHTNLDIPNNMRQTPLHLAVITRQPEMVRILIEAGASVSYPDRKGNSAIHLAAIRKDVKILQILSKSTSPLPDFNAKNFEGLTVVHLATKEAGLEVLKYVFQMGANKNASDSCSGRTPLHYAVEAENFILVNFLLENSCNVNAPTFSGNTPLHIAAGRRLKEIVALLMAYGANPAIANGEGDFPSDLPASLLMQRARMNAH